MYDIEPDKWWQERTLKELVIGKLKPKLTSAPASLGLGEWVDVQREDVRHRDISPNGSLVQYRTVTIVQQFVASPGSHIEKGQMVYIDEVGEVNVVQDQ